MTQIKLRSDLPVTLTQHAGNDHSILAAMLVSTLGQAAEEAATDEAKAYGRIRYLMANRHSSPFEHGSMTFLVEAPIFVWREHHRHRTMSYNERSGRYSVLPPEFYVPAFNRPLIQVGKPGSYQFEHGDGFKQPLVRDELVGAYQRAYHAYRVMLDYGVAKEVARMCLPVGLYSACYVTCNPRNLMHFLSLRVRDDAARFPSFPMYEIEQVARAYEGHFAALFPLTHRAYVECGRVSP